MRETVASAEDRPPKDPRQVLVGVFPAAKDGGFPVNPALVQPGGQPRARDPSLPPRRANCSLVGRRLCVPSRCTAELGPRSGHRQCSLDTRTGTRGYMRAHAHSQPRAPCCFWLHSQPPPQPPPRSALASPVNTSMRGPGGGQGGKRGQARQGRPGMGSLPSPTQKRRGRHEHRLGAALAWPSAAGYLVSRSGLLFPGHPLPKGPLEQPLLGLSWGSGVLQPWARWGERGPSRKGGIAEDQPEPLGEAHPAWGREPPGTLSFLRTVALVSWLSPGHLGGVFAALCRGPGLGVGTHVDSKQHNPGDHWPLLSETPGET